MQPNIRILGIQIALIAAVGLAIAALLANFPFPSPLIQPLLPPKLRWPTEAVMGWVEAGQIDRGFAKFFSRDPERVVPPGDNLVSAADGLVQRVDYRGDATYVVIALSFWDVHVVRTPIAGIVESIEPVGTWYDRAMPGTRTQAQLEDVLYLKGKAAPVQEIVTLKTKLGEVRVRLITSYWASRLRIWVRPGQHVAKGERLGRILLGSTVVSEFPGHVAVSAKLREHVQGGASIIAAVPP